MVIGGRRDGGLVCLRQIETLSQIRAAPDVGALNFRLSAGELGLTLPVYIGVEAGPRPTGRLWH